MSSPSYPGRIWPHNDAQRCHPLRTSEQELHRVRVSASYTALTQEPCSARPVALRTPLKTRGTFFTDRGLHAGCTRVQATPGLAAAGLGIGGTLGEAVSEVLPGKPGLGTGTPWHQMGAGATLR